MFVDKVSHLEAELRNQRSADSTTKTHLEAITKEKDELLDVIMRRGKLIQVLSACLTLVAYNQMYSVPIEWLTVVGCGHVPAVKLKLSAQVRFKAVHHDCKLRQAFNFVISYNAIHSSWFWQ